MKKRIVFLILISFSVIIVLITAFYLLFIKQDVKFWWNILNSYNAKILGSKLECKEISWCGPFKICNQQCITQDKSNSFETISVDLFKTKVEITNWKMYKISDKLAKRKNFPRIPLAVNNIIIKNGDLSLVSPIVNKINTIELKRNKISLFKQKWNLKARLHDSKVIAQGLIGDKTNLDILFEDFEINSDSINPKIEDLSQKLNLKNAIKINSKFKIKNSAFKKKNIFIQILNSEKAQISFLNLSFYPKDLEFILNPDFKFKSIKALEGDFIVNNKNIKQIVKVKKDSNNIIQFDEFPSDLLLLFIPENNDFKFNKLGGITKIEITFNEKKQESNSKITLENLKPEIYIKKKNLNIKTPDLAKISALLSINDTKLQTAELLIQKFNLKVFNNLFNDLFEIKNGEVNAKFEIIEDKFKGDLKAYINNSKNIITSNFNLNIQPKTSGIIHLLAPELDLKDIKINEKLKANTLIKNFDFSFDIKDSKIFNKKLNCIVDNIKINEKEKELLELKQGQLSSKFKDNIIESEFKNFSAIFKDNKKIIFDLTISKNLNNKEVLLKNLKLSGILPLEEVSKVFNNKGFQDFQGFLNIKSLNIEDSKLKTFISDLDSIRFKYKNQEIKAKTGQIELNKTILDFKDIFVSYNNNSKFRFNGGLLVNDKININNFNSFFNLKTLHGYIHGHISPDDLIEIFNKKLNFKLKKLNKLPIPLRIGFKPEGDFINFDFDSHFESLGIISIDWMISEQNSPGYIIAKGSINPKDYSFDLPVFECVLNGLNLTAKANGKPDNFSFNALTDPLIDLEKLFKKIKDYNLSGIAYGSINGKNVNIFDKTSFWNNLEMNLYTGDTENISIGKIYMKKLNFHYISKNGIGFPTLTIKSGRLNNLIFENVNSSMKVENNKLNINGISFDTAQGNVLLSGYINLLSEDGYLEGKANNLEVGEVARGLSGLRGFNGRGDFSFSMNGYLKSLLNTNEIKDISASGSFHLSDGNVSKLIDLQKKLNLANLVFGGPFALNLNSFLEVLMPQNNGYYKILEGEVLLKNKKIIIPITQYIGKNDLKLNTAGIYYRDENIANFAVIGSIPKIPIRVNSEGQISDFSNVLTELSPSTLLTRVNILDKRPRVFAFEMKGNPSDSKQLDSYAKNTFRWLDPKYAYDLPLPEIPKE